MNKLTWGLISTGRISKRFAQGLAASKTGELLGVASRTQEAADEFGKEFNIPRCYGSYEELLADPDIQAVYISTPHPMHAEWAVKAADAGKHILCEKPLTLNWSEAMAVVEAARRNDVFLMEAFMYRCHPQTAKLVELIRDKVIGDVKLIQATFSFRAGDDPKSRIMSNELGGGGILDVGCYCASMARLVAGTALGMPFADPIDVKGFGHLNECCGTDDYAIAVLKFPGDILAQLSTGIRLNQESVVRIFGTGGNIFVPSPWIVGEHSKIIVNSDGQEPQEIEVQSGDLYGIEADIVAACIENRQATPPAMTWDDTLGNMKTLDLWRMAIGLTYNSEKPEAVIPTIDRMPLKVRSGVKMEYGEIELVGKPVSRLVMGAVYDPGTPHHPHTFALYDEYFASGGNCIDTAYIYGTDDILGKWISDRGIREKIVILAKGAHTPNCNPEALTSQLIESLEKLQTDYTDIYMMHRDNPEIPASEFIDVLNEHVHAGRIRAFGGSNWTIARVIEANEYAAKNGLQGFSAVNNNLSLARMVNPVWPGCVHSSDQESRAWFTKTQMPLMSWSSMARGFFVRGRRDDLSEGILVDSWYSDDNFERLERAKQLAAKKGLTPVQIAMAYVLNQPFPVYALFGPATIQEMHASIDSLDIELTPEELSWLYGDA